MYKCKSNKIETTFELKKTAIIVRNKRQEFSNSEINLTYEFITTQIVKLKWRVLSNDAVHKFRLFYRHTYLLNTSITPPSPPEERFIDLSSDATVKIIDNKSYEYLLEDLNKYSAYYLVVVNHNNETSNEIYFQTPSDVPDNAPENVKIDILNATSIKLKWSSPPLEKCNGVIKGYKIFIKENEKQLINLNVDSKPEYKIINNLNSGKKYSLRILAYTVNGTGPPSDWLIAQTYLNEMDETKKPNAPLEIFAEASDKAIKVHWLPPSDSNKTIIRRYLLKYGIFIPDTAIEIEGNKDSFVIENLGNLLVFFFL